MTRKHERTAARRAAVQALYSAAIRETSAQALLSQGLIDCLDEPLTDYALKIISGVEDNAERLDDLISCAARNWTLERMPLMDLAIMRIALFEILYVDDVPVSVSINEAVELAKRFGAEDESPKFVNGMLGAITRQMDQPAVEALDQEVSA